MDTAPTYTSVSRKRDERLTYLSRFVPRCRYNRVLTHCSLISPAMPSTRFSPRETSPHGALHFSPKNPTSPPHNSGGQQTRRGPKHNHQIVIRDRKSVSQHAIRVGQGHGSVRLRPGLRSMADSGVQVQGSQDQENNQRHPPFF